MTQKEALTILKTGKNAFITGPAGSGKTYVVNEYIRYLREHDVPIGITASTGIAATHMGGVTIHSWSGIGVRDDLSEYDIESIAEKSYIRKRIEETQVLIIDEVSMLHNFRLDLVERVIRHIKGGKKYPHGQRPESADSPFGGIQVVLCGDFFQLPPISRGGFRQEPERPFRVAAFEAAPQSSISFSEGLDGIEIVSEEYGSVSMGEFDMGEPEEPEKPRTEFIYNADSWREGDFSICYLSENHRQKDDVSLTILNEIRAGVVSKESMAHIRSRHIEVLRSLPAKDSAAAAYIEPTRLFTHNLNVDSVNSDELDKVDAAEFIYEMTSKGRPMLVESLMKSCLAPQILRLRKGARVMCVKNNFDKGYVNGTLGTVVSCGPGVQPVILTAPTRDHPNGRTVAIESASWKIEDEGKVLAEITQYPLRLAWAITVHKSQGMSLDAIEVDLSRSFEPGMGYVALSRVRTLAGLTILGINDQALLVHPEVLEFDIELQKLSADEEKQLAKLSEAEIADLHAEFLSRVAPMHSFDEDGGGHVKKSKLTTFEITAMLLEKKMPLKEMAEERGMTVETIIKHIETLLENGEPVDVAYLKKEISFAHFKKIEEALAEVAEAQNANLSDEEKDAGAIKPPLLSPVKSKLSASISFKEIQLARILLGYIQKKK